MSYGLFTKISWKVLQRPVVSAQKNTKAFRATTQTTFSWFDWLFRRWLSKDQNTDWKKKCLCLWKIFHWLKIDLLLVFFMNFIWKNNVLAICIFYWIPKPNSLLPELFSYIILKQIFHTEDTSVSLFWGGMFPNRLKTLF